MKKVIFLIIAFTGFASAGFSQKKVPVQTGPIKSTIIKKSSVEKKEDTKITTMHKKENKIAESPATVSAKHPTMAKKEAIPKRHNVDPMLDSAHSAKKGSKIHH